MVADIRNMWRVRGKKRRACIDDDCLIDDVKNKYIMTKINYAPLDRFINGVIKIDNLLEIDVF